MKKFIISIGILFFLGCAGNLAPKGSKLIVRSNREIVIEERVFALPQVRFDGKNFSIYWIDKKGQLGLFIGSHNTTNIVIKEGRGAAIHENNTRDNRSDSRDIIPDRNRDFTPQDEPKATPSHI